MELSGKKILLTGALGMLGTDVAAELRKAQAEILLTDCRKSDDGLFEVVPLDITLLSAVEEIVKEFHPDWIVNCAAYTNVDKAEEDTEAANQVNAVGPEYLARAASTHGCRLLHISTDYVFSQAYEAETTTPHREDDETCPRGVYAESKLRGEEALRRLLPNDSLIVRTSWLHGVYGPNFVHTIMRLAKEKESIRVVDDQIGSPTWSGWLAQVLGKLVALEARGVFHASSRGDISWKDFAEEIVRQSEMTLEILPQTTVELNRPAPRPLYSTLGLEKLEGFLDEPCIDWKEGLRGHLSALAAAEKEV